MESSSITTPKTISWVYSNLESCRQCEELLCGEFIPTRLVQVDSEPPRLVEMNGPTILTFGHKSIKYTALSYCWGPHDKAMFQLKTEKLSFHTRLSRILEIEMTSALRDAITVCRALSISFLWVDALCIVQDDLEDWQRESSLMGRIYSNAYLTICAASSNSCMEGFLDSPVTLTVPFRSHVVSGIESVFYLSPATHANHAAHYRDISRYIYGDMYSSLWNTRGWALQEVIMSVRMLIFGQSRLHFVCSHRLQTQGEDICFEKLYTQHPDIQSNSNIDDIYTEWHRGIISLYSGRLLTHPTDRLPAISGLAMFFNEKLRDEYVAGLWRRRLHQGLDWRCGYSSTKQLSWFRLLNELTDTTAYIAPSWSWASRTCYIDFGVGKPWKQREIIEHGSITPHISLAGTNPYGQLSNATLRVTTKVVGVPTNIVFETRHDRGCVYVGSYNRPYARCRVDWGLGPDGEPLKNVPPGNLMLMLLASSSYKYHSPSLSSVSSTIELGARLEEEMEEGEEIEEGLTFGLIIYPIPDTENFLRVGTFESRPSDGWGLRIFDGCEPITFNLI